MTLSYRNAVSIAEIGFYSPAFIIACYLMSLHGWRKTAGWLFLAAFAIARLLGAAMQLETRNYPQNISLYIGAATLDNIGLSPLMLASLGLVSRVLSSIRNSQQQQQQQRTVRIPPAAAVRLVEILTVVGLILSIVGGTSMPKSSFTGTATTTGTAPAKPKTLTVGIIIFLVAFGGLCLLVLGLWASFRQVERGERRLLVAVTLSLPFLLVRLIYSSLSVLRDLPEFKWASGNTTIFLCMALVMEAVVVVIYEVTGLTLKKTQISPDYLPQRQQQGQQQQQQQNLRGDGTGSKIVSLGKKTIVGRLITAIVGK
ncbi:hypothetical protein FE257_006778 [Aspergillus nanangensis]|uniref:DUF7702 domain-containing protein n=1 Tax=Aspergillus nanangensis TaxID=2582783 RepID=A0AAD4CNT9_ASPNN|nr:hypothetical protein FE257_006778 [Aspergillus nanangensis]